MKYGAILADPPWKYDIGGCRGSADKHYTTTATEGICEIPVPDWAADDCVLFVWGTWPKLWDSHEVIAAWGFTFKTCAFVWVKGEGLPMWPDDIKTEVGMGYWTRSNTEFCLLATRGKPKRLNADVRQVIIDRRREHSRKPDEIYARIERLVDGPYLEMFARQTRDGWDAWGNQTDKFGHMGELT